MQVCDWPENAGCANTATTEESKEITTTSAPQSTEAAVISTTNPVPTTESESDENGSEDNGSDENESEGNGSEEDGSEDNGNRCTDSCNSGPWAHETDCDKFWRCDGTTQVEGTCSEGLHFNEKTKTCDFICNAGCVRENPEATAQNDGVMIFLPWDKIDTESVDKYVEKYRHSV